MKNVLLIAVLVACGSNRVEDPGAKQAAPVPAKPTEEPATEPTPTPTTPAKADPAKADPMTTFMPTLKFREHAATVLGVPASEIEGGAVDAADAASKPKTVGGAWGLVVHPKGNHQREFRGWVTADGTVITAQQNLGLLLAEVGLWAKDRKQSNNEIADKVADLLAWSYGYGFTVINYREDGMTPPTLTLKPDGSGELVFFTSYKSPGPGGAGGGPEVLAEHRIVFNADKSATLKKTN